MMISEYLYGEMIEREESRCWKELSTTAESVKKEIATKFKDEIVKLHLIEEIMIEDDIFELEKVGKLHVDSVQPTTIFSRIEVIYPNGERAINGQVSKTSAEISFEELVADGEHLSSRKTDIITGNECVYYVLPVEKEGVASAVIVGVVDAKKLSEIFRPVIYEGHANICIIDSDDGNYVMDSWHEELGNAYEDNEREKLEGYEDVELQQALRDKETGAVAFWSETTGKAIYMYFTPMDIYNWQLSIFAEEDVLFANLVSMRKLFIFTGWLEVILFGLYFCWNISTVRQLEKSNREIEDQKEYLRWISYRDMLTRMNNRNKYMEMCSAISEKGAVKIGVAYVDLNGLKQINDTMSHEEGDRYIRKAAKNITEEFENQGYRIGGDEFVILAEEIEDSIFEEKMKDLKAKMERDQVSVSVGWKWSASCEHLNGLLKEAEQQMYESKRQYYMTHDRRRSRE